MSAKETNVTLASGAADTLDGQTPEEVSGREMLLAATSTLMTEMKTFDVSLHQIARRAGVTAPLIKYYFGSKEGLLVALAQRDTARSLEQLEGLMGMDMDPANKLRIHIMGIIRTYARYPYLNGLLDSLLRDDGSESSRTMRIGFVRPLIEAQRRIVEEGMAVGQFRPIDPSQAYFLIIGACQYIFSTRVVTELLGERSVSDAYAKSYASFAVDSIVKGFLAAPAD